MRYLLRLKHYPTITQRRQVPPQFRQGAHIFLGLEFDWLGIADPSNYRQEEMMRMNIPIQWTLYISANHPMLPIMTAQVTQELACTVSTGHSVTAHDCDTPDRGGPKQWTRFVFGKLSTDIGRSFSWTSIRDLTELKILGDVLIVPVQAS